MSKYETIEELRSQLDCDVQWHPDYVGEYAVTEDGRVFSMPRKACKGGVKSQHEGPKGYKRIDLYSGNVRSKYTVHKLVLETFVSKRPENKECRHLDGNPSNNDISNLEWSTRQVNMADKKKHGTENQGSRNGNSKLTKEDVREIIRLLEDTDLSHSAIGSKFGVNTVGSINRGRTWKWFTSQYVDSYPIRD